MAVDPNDPVVVARGEGRLAAYLRESLGAIVGQPFSYIGRTLHLVELGFGEDVPAPTPKKPDRISPPHVFHCACEVFIDGQPVWDGVEQHSAWLAALDPQPVCLALDATDLGEVRVMLTGDHSLSIRPQDDEEIEHWRYFHPNDLDGHLVLYEQTEY